MTSSCKKYSAFKYVHLAEDNWSPNYVTCRWAPHRCRWGRGSTNSSTFPDCLKHGRCVQRIRLIASPFLTEAEDNVIEDERIFHPLRSIHNLLRSTENTAATHSFKSVVKVVGGYLKLRFITLRASLGSGSRVLQEILDDAATAQLWSAKG